MEEARETPVAGRYAAAAASEMPSLGLSIVLDRVAVRKPIVPTGYQVDGVRWVLSNAMVTILLHHCNNG